MKRIREWLRRTWAALDTPGRRINFFVEIVELTKVKVPKRALAMIGVAALLWHLSASEGASLAIVGWVIWIGGVAAIFAPHWVVYDRRMTRVSGLGQIAVGTFAFLLVAALAYGVAFAGQHVIGEAAKRIDQRPTVVLMPPASPASYRLTFTYAPKESTITTMDNSTAVKPRPPIRHTVDPPKSAKCPVSAKVADPQMIQCVPCTPCTQ